MFRGKINDTDQTYRLKKNTSFTHQLLTYAVNQDIFQMISNYKRNQGIC